MATKRASLLVVFGAALVLATLGYVLMLNGAKRAADVLFGAGQQSIATSLKAASARNIVYPPEIARSPVPGAEGVLAEYPPDSEATRFNIKLLETWANSAAIGNELLARSDLSDFQASSLDIPTSTAHRFDGWGNPFCIKKSGRQILIASDGAKRSSDECRFTKLSLLNGNVPSGKLTLLPDGRLGMLVDKPIPDYQ